MPPPAKRPRTGGEEGTGAAAGDTVPLEHKWTVKFKQLPPKRQVEVRTLQPRIYSRINNYKVPCDDASLGRSSSVALG